MAIKNNEINNSFCKCLLTICCHQRLFEMVFSRGAVFNGGILSSNYSVRRPLLSLTKSVAKDVGLNRFILESFDVCKLFDGRVGSSCTEIPTW